MPSTVEQLSPSRVKLTVEIPFADLKPSLDRAYAEIAKQVNIPGFRRGKVPPMVIDQRYGRGMVLQEALNNSIDTFYRSAMLENNLTPLAQPEVEVTKLDDGKLVEFTAEVDVRPEFEIPDLAGVKATVEAIEVPESMIDDQIEGLRRRFGSRETVERPAEDGDLVTIDLVALRDGEMLPGGSADGLDYTVGSGTMLDGLDEAVTGLSAGETATFTSTLVGGEHKDEESEVKVTVTHVQSQTLPEVDDELAQQAGDFDTVDELRASISERLTAMARLQQADAARSAALEALIGQLDVDLSGKLVDAEIAARREQITEQLAAANLTLDEYLAESGNEQTAEEFWAELASDAEQALKGQLVLDKLVDDLGVEADQNDLTQLILAKARAERTSPQQIAEHIKEHPHHLEEYATEIRRRKAVEAIAQAAEITDSNGERVDLARLQDDGTLVSDGADEDDSEQTQG